MPGTLTTALRNALAERRVQNLNAIEIKDQSGTVIARGTGLSWGTASGGEVPISGTPTVTGLTPAGAGTDMATARIYDDAGSSGEEIDAMTVAYMPTSTTTWAVGQNISQGDKRINQDGDLYVATEGHTTDADTEPGYGPAWQDVWELQNITVDNISIADQQDLALNSAKMIQPAADQ